MKITVASGKGGTGKTTVAVGLALALQGSHAVQLIDADVEAPNAHVFLNPELDGSRPVEKLVPQVNEALCQHCGMCASSCEFHAIAQLGERILVYPELCHGCGRCRLVCPAAAITEIPQRLGIVETGQARGMPFAHGLLDVGQAMATPIVHALCEEIDPDRIAIIDAPPGTGCPTIAALHQADVVLLVTEPTPFGLHDLRAAVRVARILDLPMGVIINRDGIGDDGVEQFCHEERIPVLLRIAFSREIAAAYAEGTSLIDMDIQWKDQFRSIFNALAEVIR
jgi:MinD superfamily P-loop ATPase